MVQQIVTELRQAVGPEVAAQAEDELEYIAGMLEDADADPEELLEQVTEMLEGLGVGEADEVARRFVNLEGDSAGGGATGSGAAGPAKLDTAITIAEIDTSSSLVLDPNVKEVQVNSNAQDLDQLVATNFADPKLKQRQAKKAAEVAVQSARLERELAEAKAAAILARLANAEGLGGLGSLRAGPFDLPNPGGGTPLIEDCHFVLHPGKRYGLIGRNGKGKSTLLKWIAARRQGVNSRDWTTTTIHYVSQEVLLTDDMEELTPRQFVLDADAERTLLLNKVTALENAGGDVVNELSQLHERLEVIDAAGAPGRVEMLLDNLGFSNDLRARPLRALSGGWRVRCALAAALFARPEVLLLDEPTNHLSIEAVLWLEHELATSATWQDKTIVVVSHDRTFLDAVTTDSLHLSGAARRLTHTSGNYSSWLSKRQQQQEAWMRARAQRDKVRRELFEWCQKAGTYANVMKQVNMKKRQIEKLDAEAEAESANNAALEEDQELPLRLEAGGVLDHTAVALKNVGFKYPEAEAELFTGVELSVHGRSRIVLLGENGAGKTTLVKVLLGDLEPTSGTVERNRHARISLVNQHHADQLDLDVSPLEFMLATYPGDGSYEHEQTLRRHLSGCGINADLALSLVRGLSGGQRSRVAMAAVSYAQPHVIVLDEPTNNLDIEACGALIECLQKFNGGVVLVSHDQHFVKSVAQEVWVVGEEPGRCTRAESFEAYVATKRGH